MALLLLAGVLLPASTASAAGDSVTLAVLGETHGTRTITKQLVSQAAAKGATGCVCPGDFIYGDGGASPSGYRSMMSPFMGNMLPAQGNHDSWSDFGSMFPGGQRYYSKDVNGVQFISLNVEYASLSSGSTQRNWLEARLSERDPSALKVVYLHSPWWLPSGAKHPTSEFEGKAKTSAGTMDALMQKHGVDLVVSGHEKNYQHSQRGGVHYVVAGGAGPEWDKYPMNYHLPGAVKRLSTDVGSVLRISGSSMTFESFNRNGGFVESFTISGSTGSPSPAPAPSTGPASASFSGSGGNEWWVDVTVKGSGIGRVEARDANTAWTALKQQPWGDYAGSIRVERGNTVQYRAILSDGRTVESCQFAHPGGGCSTSGGSASGGGSAPAPSTGAAQIAYSPSGGNEWWAQVKLGGADATRVAKVEARDSNSAWAQLSLRSWGAYAGTLRVEPGNAVEYRVTLSDGRTSTSCAYAHPAATCASGSSAPSTGTGGFTASFSNVRGNKYWVEADVKTSGATLARVEANVNGGAWNQLSKTSWGSYADSMSAPAGASVQLRAVSTDGQTVYSAKTTWSG